MWLPSLPPLYIPFFLLLFCNFQPSLLHRKMNKFISFVFVALLLAPEFISARHISRKTSHNNGVHNPDSYMERWAGKRKGADTVQIAGSSLPDCTHACGSCSPCRLVMVSFVCASLAEAETCPMAYKCMCNHKSYPVP